MNIGHNKPPSGLLPPRLLSLLGISFYGVLSGLVFFSSSVLFSATVKAHPNFDPQYADPNNYQHNYQYNYQYLSQYNEKYEHQSVGHTRANTAHSPFIAYPEMIDLWEFADNQKNHPKYDRKHDRKRFDELSPAQKERIKKRREAFKSLPPEEKERIYRAREEFHNMPPEKRQRLKEKWQNMSPEERKRAHKRKHRQKENK